MCDTKIALHRPAVTFVKAVLVLVTFIRMTFILVTFVRMTFVLCQNIEISDTI